MKGLREKLHSNKGFTLIEMLMVVAIIAILIAVSIPVVNQVLERAREATDAANERSFKAELLVCYLSGMVDDSTEFITANTWTYAYNAQEGALVKVGTEDAGKINPYGQGLAGVGKDTVQPKEGKILYGYVTSDGEVHMGWALRTADAKPNPTTLLTSDVLN